MRPDKPGVWRQKSPSIDVKERDGQLVFRDQGQDDQVWCSIVFLTNADWEFVEEDAP